jgi:uncharacterized membrane protein
MSKENKMKKVMRIIAWIIGCSLGVPIAFCVLFGLWVETIILFILLIYIGYSLDKEREANLKLDKPKKI